MNITDLLPQLMTGDTFNDASRNPLGEVPGVLLHGEGRATWMVESFPAEVTSDALDDLRIRLPFPKPPSSRAALDVTATLPANWRWADDRGRRLLLADVPAALRHSLPTVFSDLEAGIRRLCHPADTILTAEVPGTIDRKQLQEALRAPWWNEQSVIEMADGWELRPTIAAHPIPVSLHIEGEHVRCRREVVSSLGDGAIADAICLQAVRFNARLKHARLSCADGKLVAEACLHRDLISGELLADVVRAVAVVEHRVRMSFGIVREHEEIAAQFAALFAAPDLPSGPPAAVDLSPWPQKGGT
ncbi:MAG: hypothetical protein U0935_16470 [Pirellulales bacterium]